MFRWRPAAPCRLRVKERAQRVVLLVDATDAEIAAAIEAMDPEMLQLHGRETPERVSDIRRRFGRPVLKAIGIADRGDVEQALAYAEAADHLLLDAKPPRSSQRVAGRQWIVVRLDASRRA